jgi:hypothetical protein
VQTLTLSGVAASGTFKIYCDGSLSAAISWNDAVGTIQTKIRAVSGLSSAVVTGSLASQTLTVTLTSAPGLLVVQNNSLATGGAVAITFTHAEAYSSTLLPASKQNQFIVSTDNIIILPMALQPATAIIAVTATQQMAALGGYGAYTYSVYVNNSGGSIDAAGLYTAGSTPNVSDTLKVVDAFGNIATAVIAVTT